MGLQDGGYFRISIISWPPMANARELGMIIPKKLGSFPRAPHALQHPKLQASTLYNRTFGWIERCQWLWTSLDKRCLLVESLCYFVNIFMNLLLLPLCQYQLGQSVSCWYCWSFSIWCDKLLIPSRVWYSMFFTVFSPFGIPMSC